LNKKHEKPLIARQNKGNIRAMSPTIKKINPAQQRRRRGEIVAVPRSIGSRSYWTLNGITKDGKRYRPLFPTKAQAEEAALVERKRVHREGRESLHLSVADRVAAAECIRLLVPLGVSLRDAVKDFLARSERERAARESRTVSACLDEWLQAKQARVASGERDRKTVMGYRNRAEVIKSSLGSLPVATLASSHLSDFLDSLPFTKTTRTAYRTQISGFLKFCRTKGWMNHNPIDQVPVPGKERGAVEILTPAEVEDLLDAAKADKDARIVLPVIALGAFAGLRPEEAKQISWENIDLSSETPHATVLPHTSKTRAERFPPLNETCLSWLRGCREISGVVSGTSAQRFRKSWERVRMAAGWHVTEASQRKARADGHAVKPWPEDCLRHSFASYWLPVHSDRPRLAEIMGNSVAVIREHYLKPIKPGVAQRYWACLADTEIPARKDRSENKPAGKRA
jgi:integrase